VLSALVPFPMRVSDFDFELPPELIAQRPAERRDASRLLVLARAAAAAEHRQFVELPALLPEGALLVVNDARVIPARLQAHRKSGGRHEVLLVEPDAEPGVWRALVRGQLKPGVALTLDPPRGRAAPAADAPRLTFLGRDADGTARVRLPEGGVDALAAWGELPLPPYIARPEGLSDADAERYQTVYARAPGAVAAPTAGLHFTPELFAAATARGIERVAVTLHVGLGTFAPIRVDDTREHVMHVERYDVPAAASATIAAARAAGRPIVAVGTTVARTLESASDAAGVPRPGPGATQLFITPGYRFRAVDWLVTNFHLPQSTLLMLVSAFAGRERVLAAYRAAVAERYRFFSYGDAMLIEKASDT
jgi:S-adenosylmethionine:tRNA ribosyltransferase-isomerase